MTPSPLWEILVPCQYNTGKPVRKRHHQEWDKKVYKMTGGLSIHLPIKGRWLDENQQLFAERVIPVRIMCSSEQIKAIAFFSIGHYRQKAVMYYLVSSECFIITEEDVKVGHGRKNCK